MRRLPDAHGNETRRLAACSIAALGLTGCASAPALLTDRDYCNLPVGANMVRIAVQRPWKFVAGGASLYVLDDDQPVGRLENGNRLCWDRHPGKAYLAYYIGNPDSARAGALSVDLRAGQTATLEVTPSGSWNLLQKSP